VYAASITARAPLTSLHCDSAGISAYDMDITYRYTQGTNVLGLVLCGLVFGLALGTMSDEQKRPLQEFFLSLNTVIAQIIDWVIKYVYSRLICRSFFPSSGQKTY
jgi:hypothetical protein